MHPRPSVLLLLFFLVNCMAHGQQSVKTILPGSIEIDGSVIMDYTNKWKVTLVTAEGKEIPNRVWTDYGQIIELNGKKYFHRVQDLYDPNINLQETWINMVEYPSLIPISFDRIAPSGKFTHMEFDKDSIKTVTNFQVEDFQPTTTKVKAEESVYDWNLYGMLLVGLPFEKGFSAKLPFFSGQTSKMDWLVVTVEDTEELKQPNGETITTWKLATDKGLTFWLTKKAPYVHRLELQLQNNSKLIWETL